MGYLERNFPRLELPAIAELETRAGELLRKIDPTIELFSSYEAAYAALREAETRVARLETRAGDLQSRTALAQELWAQRRAHAWTHTELQERSEEVERLASRLATSERDASGLRLRVAGLEEARSLDQRLLDEKSAETTELQHQLGLAKRDPRALCAAFEMIERRLDRMDALDRERSESLQGELKILRRNDTEREQAFLRLLDMRRHRGGGSFFLDDLADEVALQFILRPYASSLTPPDQDGLRHTYLASIDGGRN